MFSRLEFGWLGTKVSVVRESAKSLRKYNLHEESRSIEP